MRNVALLVPVSLLAALATIGVVRGGEDGVRVAVYSKAQAASGEKVYQASCGECHGYDLSGGMGPALKGDEFWGSWDGKTARSLYGRIITSMPAGDPGSLSVDETLDLMAYLLRANDYPSGDQRLEKASQLDNVTLQKAK